MKSIFVTGTAGAGKSLLTSKLYEYYTKNSAFAAVLNLDPGVKNLPYTCDIDVRDYVDVVDIMQQYDLGPNGAVVMSVDGGVLSISWQRHLKGSEPPWQRFREVPGQGLTGG